jgi:anthraniloyl-CoA monooxygenase
LQCCNAEFIGTFAVLGYQADAWTFQRTGGKGPATYYFISGTNHLIRMVTGDPNVLASIRDFPNFNTLTIADDIFKITPLKQ